MRRLMSPSFHVAAAVLIGAGAQTALPQPAQKMAAPAASAASAAAPTYRSAFDGYRAYGEQPVMPWRQANDLVRQIGGWQAYAREGQGKEPADSTATPTAAGASKPPASAASGNHAGHH